MFETLYFLRFLGLLVYWQSLLSSKTENEAVVAILNLLILINHFASQMAMCVFMCNQKPGCGGHFDFNEAIFKYVHPALERCIEFFCGHKIYFIFYLVTVHLKNIFYLIV